MAEGSGTKWWIKLFNKILDENEKCVFYFFLENQRHFLVNPMVISYDPLYFSGVGCNFSFISDFIYLDPLSFFLDEFG